MKKYDVSIIIPIYNCEKYISDCVKSITNQDYSKLNKVQVLLINDGSTDNSLEICKKLKKEVTQIDIEIIDGENQGVSAARNKGIKVAKGKYIMFVDADDFISKNAIRKLVKFFDLHYDEIDIVSYPRYEYSSVKKEKKILQRYVDYFKNTGIYDVNENYDVIEPTLNVMVKNLYKDNVLFDEKIFFHEDTLYNTQIVMRNYKIGYVKEAKYLYRVYGNSTTDYKENPLYSFEQYMYVFEYLFDNFKDEKGNVPKYIQRMALNVIRYRLTKDKLLPYYLDGEEWDNAYKRIISLIQKIDNQTIIEFKQMDKYHKIFLINLKNDKNVGIRNTYSGQLYSIVDEHNILFSENKIEVVLNRFKIKNDKLYVLGYLKSPLLIFKMPELSIIYNDKKKGKCEEIIELSDKTVSNRYKTNMEVAKFYKFEFEIDIKTILNFNLKIKLEDKEPQINYIFNTWVPFSGKLKNYKVYFDDYRVQFKSNIFYISKPKKETRKKDFKRSVEKYRKIDKNITLYRVLALKSRKEDKKIWLYYDRSNILDNGYTQFKHDIKIKDEVQKYYILDGNIEKYADKFSKDELKNVVKFGSFKHKILYLNSDKILTSFSSFQEYCPFYNNYVYYKDILKYDLIYLQHGVLHANLLKMYSKNFTQIDKFVVSSQFEKNNLINNYDYSKKDIICVGMPRFDEKVEYKEPENRIIFAPSWREYLIGKSISRRREINEQKFIESKYYIEAMKFLTDKKLLELLEKNNIILDYKLHPIFEPYKKCFEDAKSSNVTVSVGETDLTKCKAFITDFSSFQFDFVRLQRPIIYFVPDMQEFKAGLHTYRKLDLEHKDAFGKLCLNGDDLVKEIINLINNSFQVEPIYKERMEKFFFKVNHRRDRLYDILKED